jgi:hypothetical protein
MKLGNWFEISELEYAQYRLAGYQIDANSERVVWRLDDQLHRTDGPAIIRASGEQVWCLKDNFHREDGPAVTFRADGYQAWFLNDKRHRVGGPAVISTDGDQKWFLNGLELTESEWKNAVSELV